MHGSEADGERFPGHEQMAQIRAVVMQAEIAGTLVVHGREIFLELCVRDSDEFIFSEISRGFFVYEQLAVPGVARRDHAVKSIHAETYGSDDLLRKPDA